MLPEWFQFTQTNLQDYVDCARRFQLLYVLGQSWPGVEAEPLVEHERFLQQGAAFHRLVERHQLGVLPELLEEAIADDQVREWWRAYCNSGFVKQLAGPRFPEYALSVEFAGVRLLAIYDLLVRSDADRVLAVDWKTYRRCPSRSWLASRVQTRMYLVVLELALRSGVPFGVGVGTPSLAYWCASMPDAVQWFDLVGDDFERESDWLQDLISQVQVDRVWLQTDDERKCRFCLFRSLCGRGSQAGLSVEMSEVGENLGVESEFLAISEVLEVGY